MKQCQRPMVNQPCPAKSVSRLQELSVYLYKKHQVYKYYSRELCPKICLCSSVWDILFYPPNSISTSSFELCHPFIRFRKSIGKFSGLPPLNWNFKEPSSCEVTLFAINSQRLNGPFPEPRIFKMYSPPHSVSIKVGNELPEYCLWIAWVSLFCTNVGHFTKARVSGTLSPGTCRPKLTEIYPKNVQWGAALNVAKCRAELRTFVAYWPSWLKFDAEVTLSCRLA